jgi:hypothetical protein
VAFDGTDTLAVFGSARIMTCSISGACKSAANGWSEPTRGTTNPLWGGTFYDGAFYGVGSDETIERKATGDTNFTTVHVSNVTFWDYWNISTGAGLGDTVVIGVVSGHYLLSTDRGTTFAGAMLPVTTVSKLKQVGNRIYGVGDSSTILSTTTGKPGEWTQATTTPTTAKLRAIASSGTLYLAVGNQGETFTSSDGLNWTHVASPGTEDGHAWRSTDHGDNWTAHNGTAGHSLRDAHFFDGQFVITGVGPDSSTTVWTSADGTTWDARAGYGIVRYGSAAAAGRVFLFGMGAAVVSTY